MPGYSSKYTIESLRKELNAHQNKELPVLVKKLASSSLLFWFAIYSLDDNCICEWPDGSVVVSRPGLGRCVKWWKEHGDMMEGAYTLCVHGSREEAVNWKPGHWTGTTIGA